MFFTISNEDSKNIFLDNTPSNFKVLLDRHYDLTQGYKCALLDFTCYTGQCDEVLKKIYIFFNIIQEEVAQGGKHNLIKGLVVRKLKLNMQDFCSHTYRVVKPMRTNVLEVLIRDEDGEIASFLKRKTTCTFHIKKL